MASMISSVLQSANILRPGNQRVVAGLASVISTPSDPLAASVLTIHATLVSAKLEVLVSRQGLGMTHKCSIKFEALSAGHGLFM